MDETAKAALVTAAVGSLVRGDSGADSYAVRLDVNISSSPESLEGERLIVKERARGEVKIQIVRTTIPLVVSIVALVSLCKMTGWSETVVLAVVVVIGGVFGVPRIIQASRSANGE